MNSSGSEDEKAINAVIFAMTDAFNNHDANSCALLFTSDADFVNVLGMSRKGIDQIERALKSRFDTALKNATVKTVDVRIRLIHPTVAIAHVLNEIEGMLDEKGRTLPSHRELSIRVFLKQEERWLVTAFHNTTVRIS